MVSGYQQYSGRRRGPANNRRPAALDRRGPAGNNGTNRPHTPGASDERTPPPRGPRRGPVRRLRARGRRARRGGRHPQGRLRGAGPSSQRDRGHRR
ncbi:MAG: hypothetical protein FJ304_08540 [Planctomycetes bacterium]|nr:hypothetical protein [Planctomycetota bacterium]